MSFTVSGLRQMAAAVRKLDTLRVPLGIGMERASQEWIKLIQEGMKKSRRQANGHSAPGEFPAVQTGMLVGSFQTGRVSWEEIEIGTHVSYAKFLDSGTSKMLPRPIFAGRWGDDTLAKAIEHILINEVNKWLGS